MISEDAPFPTTRYPRRRGSRGWLAIAVIAFVIGIGATLAVLRYVAPRFGWGTQQQTAAPTAQPTPTAANPAPPAQVSALPILSAREAALAARIADLETRIVGLGSSARENAETSRRIVGGYLTTTSVAVPSSKMRPARLPQSAAPTAVAAEPADQP